MIEVEETRMSRVGVGVKSDIEIPVTGAQSVFFGPPNVYKSHLFDKKKRSNE